MYSHCNRQIQITYMRMKILSCTPVVPVMMDRLSSWFQIKHKMPSTRSQGHAQPTLSFPRRKSCRVSSRSKTPQLERPLAPSPTKPQPQHLAQTLTRIGPLSPRRPAHQPTPLSPRRPAVPPSSPSLQPRLPLSPRKRTGETLRTGREDTSSFFLIYGYFNVK